jgi:hypothetical protein
VNQIDHILISNRFRSAIVDITVLKGTKNESDHNVLKVNFIVENKYNYKRKIVNIFHTSKWEQEYVTEINI